MSTLESLIGRMDIPENIRNNLMKYKKIPEIERGITKAIEAIETEDKETMRKIAEALGNNVVYENLARYHDNPEIAEKIAWSIGNIASEIKDPEVVKEVAEVIGKYHDVPRVGLWVAEDIWKVAYETKNANAVKEMAEIFKDSWKYKSWRMFDNRE